MTVRMQDGFGWANNTTAVLLRSADTFSWRSVTDGGFTVSGGPGGVGNTFNVTGHAYPGGLSGLFTTPLTDFEYVGVRPMAIGTGSSLTIFLGDSSGPTEQMHFIAETTTGTVKAYRGATLLGSSVVNLVPIGVSFSLVVGTQIGASENVVAYLNGAQVLNLAAQNTQTTGNASWDTLGFSSGSSVVNITDVYVATTNLGDQRILTYQPGSNGTPLNFTPSTGTNYQNVDGYPQTSTYNSSGTPGDIDVFVMAAASGTIASVRMGAMLGASDAGARGGATYCKSSSAHTTGATRALGTGAVVYSDQIPNDPNTSAPWTLVNLNAAEFGYTVVS